MSYQNPESDNIAKYRILTKPGGLICRDICLLIGCGKTTALKIINTIHEKIASIPGALMPIRGIVNRKAFCEHMGWDFDEIQSFAFAELSAINSSDSIHTQTEDYGVYGNL